MLVRIKFCYNRSRSLPTYETIFQPGMNCDFERDDCIWELFPKPNNNKVSKLFVDSLTFLFLYTGCQKDFLPLKLTYSLMCMN